MEELNNEARIERNFYQRQWRLNNKERVRKYNADYWLRRVEKRKIVEMEDYTKEECNDK